MSVVKKKRSDVWNYFSVLDSEVAVCDICKSKMSYKTMNINLKKQIMRKHPTVKLHPHSKIKSVGSKSQAIGNQQTSFPKATPSCSTAAAPSSSSLTFGQKAVASTSTTSQQVSETCSVSAPANQQTSVLQYLPHQISTASKKTIDSKLMLLFTVDMQPFSIVEDSGFKPFVDALNPAYSLPTRHTISQTMLPVMYEKCKSAVAKVTADLGFSLVESIPDGLNYQSGSVTNPSTFSVWTELLEKATSTVEIASFYWSLTDATVGKYATCEQGQQIFDALILAGTQRKLKIKVCQNLPSDRLPGIETEILVKQKVAEVRTLNFPRLVGGGLLHTKLWLVDRRHAYVGSANLDWRSLTEVKELGIYISDCPEVAEDIGKLFDVYWMMGADGAQVPDKWPDNLATQYNRDSPLNLSTNGLVYLSSSPPQFCPKGRTTDSDAITSVIAKANKFIYISVMDYLPLHIYSSKPKYWDVIDSALRTASIDRAVEVRLLMSWWPHSKKNMKMFLRSLADLSDGHRVCVSAKLFEVPVSAAQSKIPFARVNHNKYMVTDNTAYIGTSNWTADYFTTTGGVGVVVEGETELREQLEKVFLRDWCSEFAHDLPA